MQIKDKKLFRFSIFSLIIISAVFLVGWLVVVNPVLAQSNVDTWGNATGNPSGANVVANATGLAQTDPRIIIARIIQIVLGFLGILAVCLILYGGWLWMMAKGDVEQIAAAKKVLLNAVIGLVIILSAFAIATFFVNQLSSAVKPGGGDGTVCAPPCSGSLAYCCQSSCQASPCGNLPGVNTSNNPFSIIATTPANNATNVIRNVVARFRFSAALGGNSVDQNSVVVTDNAGATIETAIKASGDETTITPTGDCGVAGLKCFAANAAVKIKIKSGATGVLSADGRQVVCGLAGCDLQFGVGTVIDQQAPTIEMAVQNICSGNANNRIGALASDDSGIPKIEFYLNNEAKPTAVNSNAANNSPFKTTFFWDASGYDQPTVNFRLRAYDLDSHNVEISRSFTLAPAHCCNNVKDGNETNVDCGGDCLSCDQLLPFIDSVSPQGGFCSNDINKFCTPETALAICGVGNTCDQKKSNGMPDNFVTISGSGFGSQPGQVFFSSPSGWQAAKLANDPTAGNPACAAQVWTNNEIVAIVPAGASLGPIKVQTAVSATSTDTTAFAFTVNQIARPGLCDLSPDQARLNKAVAYQGVKLTQADAYFGNEASSLPAIASTFKNDKTGTALVPNLANGLTSSYVTKDSVPSNYLEFVKAPEPVQDPIISSIEPISGPIGAYLTIRGANFGTSQGAGQVYFGSAMSGKLADWSFPAVCANGLWNSNQIVVKVPSGLDVNGNYPLTVKTNANQLATSPEKFTLTTEALKPGLCKLEPSLGQGESTVTYWGEYFGSANAVSKTIFNKNIEQTKFSYWGQDATDNKASKIITTVPATAITGPTNIFANNLFSNSLNFTVGRCIKDGDCGNGNVCCSANTPEAGRCHNDASECSGVIKSCVFEWSFAVGTPTTTCADGTKACGKVCCSGACDPLTTNKCAACAINQNQCGNGACCSAPCNPNTKPSSCSLGSCAGSSLAQCLEGITCPNSGGICSPFVAYNQQLNTCDYSCKDKCGATACLYNSNLNKCQVSGITCSLPLLKILDQNNQTIPQTPSSCVNYKNNPHWQIGWSAASCPAGWEKAPNNQCVDILNLNGACSLCADPFQCFNDNNVGRCAIAQNVCPDGATCGSNNTCDKTRPAGCACCCRKDHASEDCCMGLKCAGACGAETDPNNTKLGKCGGCASIGSTVAEHDAACNCLNSSGKFCDLSTPAGTCDDCSSVTTAGECSQHQACCFDAKTNTCRGGDLKVNEAGINYCGYYGCTQDNNKKHVCDEKKLFVNPDPSYITTTTCASGCPGLDEPLPGQACVNPANKNSCSLSCSQNYFCLSAEGIFGIKANPATCACCCDPNAAPANDTCKPLSLKCLPDKAPCSGGQRGLCCGCSSDDNCGQKTDVGCGLDTCCRPRPKVVDYQPSDRDGCRNPLIKLSFDQAMAPESLTPSNLFLVGDYGSDKCPAGASTLALNNQSTVADHWWSRALNDGKKLAVKILPGLKTNQAFAAQSNYCRIVASPQNQTINDQTTVTFHLAKPLDINIEYFVVARGDQDLNSKTGVLSLQKIGLRGDNIAGLADFNGVVYPNSQIWSFKTGDKICQLDKLQVSPAAWLFTKPANVKGSPKNFQAKALDSAGREIFPITDVYSWRYSWTVDDPLVAKVTAGGDSESIILEPGNPKDAQTKLRARATVVADQINTPSTKDKTLEALALIRVFFCNDPWPAVPDPSLWPWTWRDSSTNCQAGSGLCLDFGFEFYYCRDKGAEFNTASDLPALTDDKAIIRGQTTVPETTLKQYYFFRAP